MGLFSIVLYLYVHTYVTFHALSLPVQSSSKFVDREAILTDLETYGGAPDCQRFRDVMMYSLSVFSFGVPQAINLLADTFWRPRLLKSEVRAHVELPLVFLRVLIR